MIKIFSKSICLADEVRPPNQYWGSIHPIGAPKTPLSCYIGRTHSYQNLALKFQSIPKKRLFPRKCCFCCLCCILGVANVVFQNLPNLEIFLAIFIFSIRRLVKKLFDFEVMFRSGGGYFRIYINEFNCS